MDVANRAADARAAEQPNQPVPRIAREADAVAALLRAEARLLEREEALRRSLTAVSEANARLELAEEVGRIGHWRICLLNDTLSWSREIYRIHGVVPDGATLSLESAIACFHSADRRAVKTAVAVAIRDGTGFTFKRRLLRPDGEVRHVESRGMAQCDPSGKVVAVFGTLTDVTEQHRTQAEMSRLHEGTKRALEKVAESEARFRMLADHTSDMITSVGRDGHARYVSPSSLALLGRAPEEVVGTCLTQWVAEDDRPLVEAAMDRLYHDSGRLSVQYRALRRDGTQAWIEASGRLAGDGAEAVVAWRDITERKRAEQALVESNRRLEAMANTDALTGLANRRRFDEALAREWRLAERHGTELSLILLDIDCFKAFNDLYGHQAGDDCLREVANAVASISRRSGDLAARHGGEEMTVLLPATGTAAAAAAAEQIRFIIEALGAPHAGNAERGGVVTASFGVATASPGKGPMADRHALFVEADSMMYEAKRTGRNRVVVSAHAAGPSAAPAGAPSDEAARLAALDACGATGRSAYLDRIARLAASVMGAPVGLVSLVGRDRQVFAGNHGLDGMHGTPRDQSFCAHTILGEEVFTVPDATLDPRFRDNALVTGDVGLRFYAGAPLVSADGGHRLGAVCVIDRKARQPLSAAHKTLLADLADMAMRHIEQATRSGASAEY